MKTIRFYGVLFIAILLCSCNKEEAVNPEFLPGTYEGLFTVSDFGATYSNSAKVSIELRDQDFVCHGNSKNMPAGGEGSFHIKGDKLVFDDKRVWAPGIDLNQVLRGSYDYEYDGAILHFWRINGSRHYDYHVARR